MTAKDRQEWVLSLRQMLLAKAALKTEARKRILLRGKKV